MMSEKLLGTPPWSIGNRTAVWSLVTGTSSWWLCFIIACLLVEVLMRCVSLATSFHHLTAKSIQSPTSELVMDDIEDVVLVCLVIVGMWFTLHAMDCEPLKDLIQYPKKLTCSESRTEGYDQFLGKVVDEDQRQKGWEERITLTKPKPTHTVYLICIGLVVWLCALCYHLRFSSPAIPPPVFSILMDVIAETKCWLMTGVGTPWGPQFFIGLGSLIACSQFVWLALRLFKLFTDVCSKAILAFVDMLDEHTVSTELLLRRHSFLMEQLNLFWQHEEIGTAFTCGVLLVGTFGCVSGFHLLIIVTQHDFVDSPRFQVLVLSCLLSAVVLMFILWGVASLTTQCISVRPRAKSIVAAMRRYTIRKLGTIEASEERLLLMAGVMVETQTTGVKLMGAIEVSYGFFFTMLIRLFFLLPTGFAFVGQLTQGSGTSTNSSSSYLSH